MEKYAEASFGIPAMPSMKVTDSSISWLNMTMAVVSKAIFCMRGNISYKDGESGKGWVHSNIVGITDIAGYHGR